MPAPEPPTTRMLVLCLCLYPSTPMRKCRVSSRLGPALSAYFRFKAKTLPQRAEPCSSPGRVLRCSLEATRAITAYRPVKISRKRGVWPLHARGSGCAIIALQAFSRPDRFMPGCQRMARAAAAHQISGRGSSQIHQGVGVFCNQRSAWLLRAVLLRRCIWPASQSVRFFHRAGRACGKAGSTSAVSMVSVLASSSARSSLGSSLC